MNDVERIVDAVEKGDQKAAEELLPLVYAELRNLAKARLSKERSNQTLQATDLVHEAYHRLVVSESGGEAKWNGPGHFFGAAAEAMRRILIDRARSKATQKRGGDRQRVEFDAMEHPAADEPERLLLLDEALEKLERNDFEKARLVKLRFFAQLTNKQAASALGISEATANRQWAFARAWLKKEMDGLGP